MELGVFPLLVLQRQPRSTKNNVNAVATTKLLNKRMGLPPLARVLDMREQGIHKSSRGEANFQGATRSGEGVGPPSVLSSAPAWRP